MTSEARVRSAASTSGFTARPLTNSAAEWDLDVHDVGRQLSAEHPPAALGQGIEQVVIVRDPATLTADRDDHEVSRGANRPKLHRVAGVGRGHRRQLGFEADHRGEEGRALGEHLREGVVGAADVLLEVTKVGPELHGEVSLVAYSSRSEERVARPDRGQTGGGR